MTKISLKKQAFENNISKAESKAQSLASKKLTPHDLETTNAKPFTELISLGHKLNSLISEYDNIVQVDIDQFKETKNQLVQQDNKIAQGIGSDYLG